MIVDAIVEHYQLTQLTPSLSVFTLRKPPSLWVLGSDFLIIRSLTTELYENITFRTSSELLYLEQLLILARRLPTLVEGMYCEPDLLERIDTTLTVFH